MAIRGRRCIVTVVIASLVAGCRSSNRQVEGGPRGEGALAKEPPCDPVPGERREVTALRGWARSADGPFAGLIRSEGELAATGIELEGGASASPDAGAGFDFAQIAIAYRRVPQTPSVRVQWAVETATELVVGFRGAPSCGGAPPPDGVVAVAIPAGSKPVRFAQCAYAPCSSGGPPLP